MTKALKNIRLDSLAKHEKQASLDIYQKKQCSVSDILPPLASDISESVVIGLA
jgi:hypothetical protein